MPPWRACRRVRVRCPRGRTSALVFKALCAQGSRRLRRSSSGRAVGHAGDWGDQADVGAGVVESAGMVQAPGRPRCASYQIVGPERMAGDIVITAAELDALYRASGTALKAYLCIRQRLDVASGLAGTKGV